MTRDPKATDGRSLIRHLTTEFHDVHVAADQEVGNQQGWACYGRENPTNMKMSNRSSMRALHGCLWRLSWTVVLQGVYARPHFVLIFQSKTPPSH